MSEVPDIAVVGHTNTGKTSLLRTLTRRRDFGQISAHPATTRHVEMAELAVAGRPVMHLFDTPGFEDSSGLLVHIETLKANRREDWIETLQAFAGDPSLHGLFGQEAKALNQVLASDVLLYVIDARDPVRAKHRDELELLGRCGKPVLPVLNFIAADTNQSDAWRAQLARVNMHAVVPFDTVVYREADELALYAKIATLADRFAPILNALIAELTAARAALRRASARILAELTVDVAAARLSYPAEDKPAENQAAERLKANVRQREQSTVQALLRLHRFSEADYVSDALPFAQGAWQQDLFDPATLARLGAETTKAAATGATAGLAIDLVTGGLTLGAAALAGATVGVVFDGLRRYGGRLLDLARGYADMTVADSTLQVMISRELALIGALLGRGHGAQEPVRQTTREPGERPAVVSSLLKRARGRRDWSTLSNGGRQPVDESGRDALVEDLTEAFSGLLSSDEADGHRR